MIDTGDIVFCSVEELCGSTGWRRVGIADFRDPETPCPETWNPYGGAKLPRGCGRRSRPPTGSMTIPTSGISYSQVCGKVIGYPWRSLDAFNTDSSDIEESYLDGVSVTHGPTGSRQHIFSLAGASGNGRVCPCADSSTFPDSQPDFVGDDYYCESGREYRDDPLWDGEKCASYEAICCTSPYIPYFYRHLNVSTTDDIELRILTDEDFSNENIYILAYEMYVK